MKFLCITCDEQMKLERTLPPDNDAISAVFTCPRCGASFAMHTNVMETQLVRSLGVRVGGGAGHESPMRSVRSSLTGVKDIAGGEASRTYASGFSEKEGGKCPFTGAVREADERAETDAAGTGPVWTEEARERLERVPAFVRSMVEKGIEDIARERGYAEITEEVMAEVRVEMGM